MADRRTWKQRVLKHYLVGLNGSDLLVELDVIANLLVPLLQGALGDRLSHLRNLDNGVGIRADLGHEDGQRKLAS